MDLERLQKKFVVIKEFATNFKESGTLFSSSNWAAEALSAPLRKSGRDPMRIIEVGAGAGPVTAHIIKHMMPGDELVICEINENLMEALQLNICNLDQYQEHKERITFFTGPIQDFPEEDKFDLIVCALPFLNFEVELIEEIIQKFNRITTEDAFMTYYEYMGIRQVSKVISPKDRKRRIREIDTYIRAKQSKHQIGRTKVWLNVLPMNVYTWKLAA